MINLFKKKKVPDELPDISLQDTSGEIEENLEDKEIIKRHLNADDEQLTGFDEPDSNDSNINDSNDGEMLNKIKSTEIEDSFFTDLQNDLVKEVNSLNKLEKWYNNKFLPGDVVSDMRGYWEGKKSDSIVKVLGRNFQQKISGKIIALQKLEKEWQDIYFTLVEKEEEIRIREKELKKMLKEFIELCKKRKRK